jgi:hypothetical protein
LYYGFFVALFGGDWMTALTECDNWFWNTLDAYY